MRETYEETGLMLGVRSRRADRSAGRGRGRPSRKAGIAARSRRRPFHRPRHYAAEPAAALRQPLLCRRLSAIAHRADGFVGPEAELVELVWLPITEARRLDMPGITAIVLEELQDRIAAGMSHDHPVPLYRMLHKRFVRETCFRAPALRFVARLS